eukprot:2256326-Amphidinium_carterae.1
MAHHRERKIQRNKNDGKLTEGPPSGLRAEGGTYGNIERKRTSLIVAFDMVAELAIAERVIGLASLLASRVVTRASQLLYYIAWLC